MSDNFPNWLTETMIQGARGFNLDAYVMALEGWRRGLTLTWYLDPSEVTDLKIIGFNPLGKSFSLQSEKENKTHYFYRSRGDKVANEAVDLVHNKFKAKQLLLESGVSTPKGFKFNKEDNINEIIDRFKKENLDFPVVIKPIFGSLGKGVITNVNSEEELLEGLKTSIRNEEYDQFVIEQHINGDEYRLYVVDGEVVGATKREPVSVIGNGKSTIKELIQNKNEVREKNPYLRNKLIEIDDDLLKYISEQDLTLNSIIDKDQKIRLKSKGNITAGGEPVDVRDILPDAVKKLAINSVEAIPGLIHCGIDIITQDNEPYIIEMNATAGISIHLFPVKGRPQNVPEKIMDFYFPETKGISKALTKMYFDYRDISSILRNQLAQEITLTDAPKGKMYTARYIVSGKVQNVNYRAWIKRQALGRGLHGYTRNLKNGNVVAVVASDNLDKIEEFKETCKKGPARAKVEKVKQLEWKSIVKVGFEIRKSK